MRSILVSLGPWQWPAVFGIAAVLFVAVLIWRRVERALGEPPGPIDAPWFAFTVPSVLVAATVVLLLINHFAPVPIRSYGVMLLCGFVAGMIYASRVGPARGLTVPMIVDMALLQLVLAITGARVLYVLLEFHQYAAAPKTILNVSAGGLSFHGGVLGAIVGTVLFCLWRRARFAVLADICTPALCLGYAFTRIGCFLNGCCHGGPTNLPWGVIFPENKAFPMPVHPTQLYASAGSVALFFITRAVWPKLHRPGQLFPLYLFLYSAVLRFLCEYTRAGFSAEMSKWTPSLTVAQVACIFIAAGALVWLWVLQRMPYENPMTAQAIRPQEPPAPAAAPAPPAAKPGKTPRAEGQPSGRRRKGK